MASTPSRSTKSRLLVPAALLAFTLGPWAFRRHMRKVRDDHQSRGALWHHFYAMDWGETTTNNYGYAPADGSDPQRFQQQLYRELFKLLEAKAPARRPLRLLEVSCGRGGGLKAFLSVAPDQFDATGLDVAPSAIAFCRSHYSKRLRFVEGSALDLPFADGRFDVVLNVEASNDYGDRPRFFSEVARVLTGDGIFLYAESLKSDGVDGVASELGSAGFRATFRDVTRNVLEACRLDTARRREMIKRRASLLFRLLFARQLENYAAIEGTRKFRSFADGRRTYVLTAATKE
jgi:ubiquinone/menaquinone biosynthesis C-methylase UbiE